ncbi:MAG: response regulator transcription factor [Rhodocyclales bacterium]|nr:response regulator transcription factor [Rhodocyclales bacterium]
MPAAEPDRLLKVVLIEDSLLLCQALGAELGELSGVQVVGQAEDERSAIKLLQRQQPHLAIVDLQLRAGSGLGVLRALRRDPEQFGSPRAVVFSSHGEPSIREHCFAFGVDRFFDKATQVGELLAYVRQAIPS